MNMLIPKITSYLIFIKIVGHYSFCPSRKALEYLLRETAPINSLFIKCQNINQDKKKVIEYLRNKNKPSEKEVLKKWKWQNSSKTLCDFIQKIS